MTGRSHSSSESHSSRSSQSQWLFGEGRLAGSQEQSGVAYFYGNERATLAQQPVVLDRRTDAFDRAVVVEQSPYIASERSAPARPDVSTYLDANERGAVLSTPSVTPSSTGGGIEWPQVGIGFGVGMALGHRPRPVAQGDAASHTGPPIRVTPRPDRPRPPHPGRSWRAGDTFPKWQVRPVRTARATGGEP